jgi:hypothetical protein
MFGVEDSNSGNSLQRTKSLDLAIMTTQRITVLIFTFLSASYWGQSMPYGILKTLEDCATELRQVAGVTAELKLKHSDSADTRRFRLTLETPNGHTNIQVGKDGKFRLPQVAPEVQNASKVSHSLEKGALTLSFICSWEGTLPDTQKSDESLFTLCTTGASSFDKLEPTFVKLGRVIPDFADFQMAITGVSILREKPSSGFALLKNGDKTVATIDLSQTGKASWMFADYDPKTHRIVWDMKNNEPEPKVSMEILYGKEAVGLKQAIMVRHKK